MNPAFRSLLCGLHFSGRLMSVVAAGAGLAGATASAAPAPAVSAPKTHTLFMGADILLEQDRSAYRVKDVEGGAFVIERKGRLESVPMNRGVVNMRVDLALKLTELSADITGLKAERAYTPDNDPNRKFLRQTPGGAGDDQAALAFGSVNNAYINQAGQGIAMSAGAYDGAKNYQKARDVMATATDRYGRAQLAASSDLNSPAYFAGRLQQELAKEEFDAIDLSFEVSAPRPIANPYIVVTAGYRGKDDHPGVQRNWVYAQALPPIGLAPQKVRVRQGGFPPGYELQGFQVHLYDHGTEIATTVAPKRVTLTRDEALQYVVMEYVSAHKNSTVPAKPVMGRVPADLPGRLAQGRFAAPVFVKVSKDGLPLGAFADENCARQLEDPYLDGVIKDLRFTPALAGGKPVEGVARVELKDLHLTL